jgi:O-antigen/teichoic acid export membrane protein
MTPTRISEAERLIDSSRLTRNVGLSLGSQILPVVTAILLLPVLIGGLGDERFGVLALVWMIVGYFTLFDLGLSRALARYAAESLGNNRSHEVPAAFWTSLALMVATSVATAAISAAAVPWLVRDLLHLTGQLAIEAIDGFYVACATIPIVVVSGTLRGLLEAKQLFVQLTLVRIPSSVWNFLGPALLLPLTNALPVVIAALALGRVIALAALAKYVIRAYSGLWPARTERALIVPDYG